MVIVSEVTSTASRSNPGGSSERGSRLAIAVGFLKRFWPHQRRAARNERQTPYSTPKHNEPLCDGAHVLV
jgi:hypothetical protein